MRAGRECVKHARVVNADIAEGQARRISQRELAVFEQREVAVRMMGWIRHHHQMQMRFFLLRNPLQRRVQ